MLHKWQSTSGLLTNAITRVPLAKPPAQGNLSCPPEHAERNLPGTSHSEENGIEEGCEAAGVPKEEQIRGCVTTAFGENHGVTCPVCGSAEEVCINWGVCLHRVKKLLQSYLQNYIL